MKSSNTHARKVRQPVNTFGVVLARIWFAVIGICLAVVACETCDALAGVEWSHRRCQLRTLSAVLARGGHALVVVDTTSGPRISTFAGTLELSNCIRTYSPVEAWCCGAVINVGLAVITSKSVHAVAVVERRFWGHVLDTHSRILARRRSTFVIVDGTIITTVSSGRTKTQVGPNRRLIYGIRTDSTVDAWV